MPLTSKFGTPAAGVPAADPAATPAPKKGGIDPNTGEWSENPSTPKIAGQDNGQGGHYGVTETTPEQDRAAQLGGGYAPFHNYNPAQKNSYGGRLMPSFGGNSSGYMDTANLYGRNAYAAGNRAAAQIDNGQANKDLDLSMQARGQQDMSRGSQMDALGLQRNAAMGLTPSVAQIQQQTGIDSALKAQLAAANSAKGGGSNMAAAQRQAAFAGSDMQLQGVNQAAMLRAGEMAQARDAYMQGASGVRQGDMSLRAQDLQQRGMSADQAFRQAQLEAQQRGLNDQTSLGYYGLANQTQLGQLQADTDTFKAELGADAADQQNDMERKKAAAAAIQSSTNSIAMMSDIRAKAYIMPAGNQQTPRALGQNNAVSEGTKRPAVTAMPGPSPFAAQGPGQASPGSMYMRKHGPMMPVQPMQMPARPAPMGLPAQMQQPALTPPPVPNMNRPAPPMQGPVPMYPSSPLMAQPTPNYGQTMPGVMSDANVKRDVHAAGYEAGIRDAMARLKSGNGTAGQRNADIDADIARMQAMRAMQAASPPTPDGAMARLATGNGTAAARNADIDAVLAGRAHPMLNAAVPGADAMPPHSTVSPATWDRMQNIRAGNGSQRDIDAELAQMASQLPSGPPRRRDPVVMEPPIEDLHRAPYADYNEDADKNLGWTKDRNADYGVTKENWPASDDTRQSLAARADTLGSFGPDRLYSDENLKIIDPVLKQKYVNPYGEGRAKMKNEGEHGPEKDPGKFPMQRALGVVSDKSTKDAIDSQPNHVDAFLESAKPYEYKYKNPQDEPTPEPNGGRYLGAMAQNLEMSPTGNTLVKDTPRGKMLEGGALLSALTAGVGRLHERISALEPKSKKAK